MSSLRKSKDMARPLGVRGHQKRSHLVASYKMDGAMYVESFHESTTLLALDIDPRTRTIVSQPFTVRLDLEQLYSTKSEAIKAEPRLRIKKTGDLPIEEQIYTPDFLVGLTTPVPWVVESKSNLEIEKIPDQLKRRQRALNNLGYHYLVVSSTDLDHKGLHSNLVHMRDAMKFRRQNGTQLLLGELTDLVGYRRDPFPLGEIKGRVSDVCIYLGLIAGVIGCDLRSGNLGVNTLLWQGYGDLSHLQLLALDS